MPPSTPGGPSTSARPDYLRFADGARFFASPSQPSVLTVVDHPGHDPDPCRPPRPEARGGDLGAIDHRHLAADLRVDPDAGGLEVAGDLTTGFFSAIASRAFSSGAAGNIDITADSVLLRNRAVINTPSLGAGRGGDLMEWSRTLELLDAGGQAFISTSAFGTGDSGKLTMFADSVLAPAGAGGFLSGSPARRPGASR
jgi:hypothetical protein